jgi:hypothetical protein
MLLISTLVAAVPLTENWSCQTVGTMPGPEDFVVLSDTELLVSSDDRRGTGQGAIVRLNLETKTETILPITGRDSCSFHPHGIFSTSTDLYIVLHYQEEESSECQLQQDDGKSLLDGIEHFALAEDGLHFIERLQSPLMREPNDLVVAPTGEIFITDNPEFTTVGMLTAIVFGRRPSVVLSYQQGSWEVAADRFLYSNGVLLTPEGWLWVATYGGHLYGLREIDGKWSRRGHSQRKGALDNLMVAADNSLVVAGHPKPFAFLSHAKSPENIGPSVIYILLPLDDGWGILAAYEDESGTAQASSTATLVGGKLVIAQVFEPGIVVCTSKLPA